MVPVLAVGNFHSISSVSFTIQERTIGKNNSNALRGCLCLCMWKCMWMRGCIQAVGDAGRINSQTRPERVAPFLGDNLTTNECECEYCFCILLFVFLLFYTHTRTVAKTGRHPHMWHMRGRSGKGAGLVGIRLCKKQEIRIKIYEYSLW